MLYVHISETIAFVLFISFVCMCAAEICSLLFIPVKRMWFLSLYVSFTILQFVFRKVIAYCSQCIK